MTKITYQYSLPDEQAPADIFEHFEALGELRVEPPLRVRYTYLDTFDWRLYAVGTILVEEQAPYATRILWRQREDNRLLAQLMIAAPQFVRDLPPGGMRAAFDPLVEMRALLPMVSVNLQSRQVALINKQRKTILRLVIEEGGVTAPDGQNEPLPPRLRLEPLKGYRQALQRARQIVEQTLRLEPAEPLFDAALTAAGREAGDYSSKLRVDLVPELAAGEALRRILLELLETMECNLEGMRTALDSEFLHDFRVAVRRTRSAFSQVKGVLPAKVLNRFRPGFKWLGQITGPTRDLDVYLLKLPAYRNSLPQVMQESLQPLHDFLARHQKQEQRKLARSLSTVRFRRLLDDWRSFLEADWMPHDWPAKADQPIGPLANKQIWKSYRRVMRAGAAIREDSPPEVLHELRIRCKKLRYLMEFFISLYPQKEIRTQIKALKSLQDNLGDFHDLEVQAEALRRFGSEMQTERRNLPGETLMVIGMLIDALQRHQQAERRKFVKCFARFARPGNQRLCREMFHAETTGKEIG
jgi:CHAD domain-containing protein